MVFASESHVHTLEGRDKLHTEFAGTLSRSQSKDRERQHTYHLLHLLVGHCVDALCVEVCFSASATQRSDEALLYTSATIFDITYQLRLLGVADFCFSRQMAAFVAGKRKRQCVMSGTFGDARRLLLGFYILTSQLSFQWSKTSMGIHVSKE